MKQLISTRYSEQVLIVGKSKGRQREILPLALKKQSAIVATVGAGAAGTCRKVQISILQLTVHRQPVSLEGDLKPKLTPWFRPDEV